MRWQAWAVVVLERFHYMPHVSLDGRESQLKGLRNLPVSLPTDNGAARAQWSTVPLWRGLDSDFLCAPSIPKAPLTPRVKVEMVGRTLRISDEDAAVDALMGEQLEQPALEPSTRFQQRRLLLLFAAVGFLGGIVVAWLLGVLG